MTAPIHVRERGRVEVGDHLEAAVPAEFWKAAGCRLTKSAGESSWMLEAGDLVGVSRVSTALGDVTLQVLPKLATADVFFLADYAYDQRHEPLRLLPFEQVELDALRRDPAACLLVWHARAIHRFATRWLRRDYRRVDQVLNGKIKGKPLISRYVSQHLAVGDPARIPCRVKERTQDTPNNRLLKAGLHYILSRSHELELPAARRVAVREAKAALPLFSQVSDIRTEPVSQRDLTATTHRGAMSHYRSILLSTEALLRGEIMGPEVGAGVSTASFMWDMPTLFQEALRGVIDSAPGLALSVEGIGRARVHAHDGKQVRSSKVDPDLVLETAARGQLVIDTKYKDVLPSDHGVDDEDVTLVADRRRIKVTRADIYQVVAYTAHDKWRGATGALLYPVVLAEGDTLPRPMQIRGFGPPVWMLFVDVGQQAKGNLPAFLDSVRELADRSAAGAVVA